MGVHHATSGGVNDVLIRSGTSTKTNKTNSTSSSSGTTGSSSSTLSELSQIGTKLSSTIGQMLNGTQDGGGSGNQVSNKPGNTNTSGNTNSTGGTNSSGGTNESGSTNSADVNSNGSNGDSGLTATMKKVSIFSSYDDNSNSKLEYSDKKTAAQFEGKQLNSNSLTSSNAQLKQLSSNIQSKISSSITQKLSEAWQNSITSFSKDYQSQEVEVEYQGDTMTANGQKAHEQAQKGIDSGSLTLINTSISEINQQIQTDIQQALQDAISEAKQQQIDSGSIELDGKTYEKVDGEENKFTCDGQTYTYDGNNMTPETPKAGDAGAESKFSNETTQYTAEDASTVISRAIDNNAYNNMSPEDRQKVDDLVYDYMDSHESATLADVQKHLADNGIDPASFTKSRAMDMSKVDTNALWQNADGSNMNVRDGISSGKASSMDDFILRDEMALRKQDMSNLSHRGELRQNERALHTSDGGMGIEADLNDFAPDSKYDNPYTASLLNYKGVDGTSYMNTVIKGKNGDVLVEAKGGQLQDSQGNKINQKQAEEILKNAHETGQLSKLLTYS